MSETVHIDTPSGTVTGLIAHASDYSRPLLVCIHGGGYTSGYFDVDGVSFLKSAAENGYTTVALNRPGYATSSPLPEEDFTYARSAKILDDAITELWAQYGEGRPGVVLLSHSIGGAVAVHLAASGPAWPLLGISMSGLGATPPPGAGAAWNGVPARTPVPLPPEARRFLLYGPEHTTDPLVIDAAELATQSAMKEELDEIYQTWPADLLRLAPSVTVPVHYTIAEFDKLWIATDDAVAAFAAPFVKAGFVDAFLSTGVGHNIDHHHDRGLWHDAQYAFIERCLAEAPASALASGSAPVPSV